MKFLDTPSFVLVIEKSSFLKDFIIPAGLFRKFPDALIVSVSPAFSVSYLARVLSAPEIRTLLHERR